MIHFSSLIKIAPFPEEMKKDFLEQENQLSEDQKLRLAEAAWDALAMLYSARVEKKFNEMMMEMTEGKKVYTPNDFQEEKGKLVFEFAQMLDSASSEGDLEEVRKQLQAHTKTSPPTVN